MGQGRLKITHGFSVLRQDIRNTIQKEYEGITVRPGTDLEEGDTVTTLEFFEG